MIITIFREEYLTLIAPKRNCHQLRCCMARLIQLFRWLSSDGEKEVQITHREIHKKLLGKQSKNAIATHAGLRGAR